MHHLQDLDREHVCGYYCAPPQHADVIYIAGDEDATAELLALVNRYTLPLQRRVLSLRPTELDACDLSVTRDGYWVLPDGNTVKFSLLQGTWTPWLATYEVEGGAAA